MANQIGRTFGSDNHAGVHAEVLAAIVAANTGDAIAYGNDPLTRGVLNRLRATFGADQAYLVFNGTAANILGLSLLLRPYEAVICAQSSHLNVDECGAAERLLGCKLLPVDTPDGKLTPDLIASRLTGRGDEHRVQPRVVQLAQVTELGTCYTLPELRSIAAFSREQGLLTYLDGARLANAAAHLGCELADIAAHVDVLSFGGTKNGALGVEAVLVRTPGLGTGGRYRRKQLMQLASKMRFLAAQMDALLTGDLWLTGARHANAMAQRLAEAVSQTRGAELAYPVQSNGVFVTLGLPAVEALQQDWSFGVWSEQPGGRCTVRLMTAFNTSGHDVDALAAAVRRAVSRETASTDA
ncbi:MAG: threonine aldolase family protein [Streptosporangiaceae bacterium]